MNGLVMFRFLFALLFCAGLLLAQRDPAAQGRSQTHGTPLDKAWDLVANGQRDQAVRLLRELIKSRPRDADARLLLGSILQEEGDRSESIAQLAEAVRLRPRSAEAQNALGEAYNTFGDAKAARGAFEKAVVLNPGFSPAQVNLGLILVEAGEFPAAADHLDRAVRSMGRTADAAYPRYLLAKAYTAQNQTQKAAAQLEQAVALRPDFPEAWSDLGLARKALLDDIGALAAMKRAVSLKPTDAIAQYRLGTEYLHQHQPHLAVTHLEEAYRLNPEDQSTLNSLQFALRQDGKTEEAGRIKQVLSDLLRKRDRVRQNAVAAVRVNNEGASLEKAGNLSAALDKYREALNLSPEHVGIRVNYAVALLRLGQWTQGLTELHEALRRDPQDAKIKAALDDAIAQAPPGTVPNWADAPSESSRQ
jgi:tetratricopeptide (TPR) repeat protein